VIIIGDIHGKTSEYVNLLKQFPGESSIQIGDFGVGFRGVNIPDLPEHNFSLPT
jgi:hypothetical protein